MLDVAVIKFSDIERILDEECDQFVSDYKIKPFSFDIRVRFHVIKERLASFYDLPAEHMVIYKEKDNVIYLKRDDND